MEMYVSSHLSYADLNLFARLNAEVLAVLSHYLYSLDVDVDLLQVVLIRAIG